MVKDNRKEKRRDECSICRKADRNPIGHLAEWCVYEGGPFFEKGMDPKDRIRKAAAAKKEKELKSKGVEKMSETELRAEVRSLRAEVQLLQESISKVKESSQEAKKMVKDLAEVLGCKKSWAAKTKARREAAKQQQQQNQPQQPQTQTTPAATQQQQAATQQQQILKQQLQQQMVLQQQVLHLQQQASQRQPPDQAGSSLKRQRTQLRQ